jgi:prepilin peptidase CpaA
VNLIFLAPLWLVAILACILVAAAIQDAARFRISNMFPILVLAGALIAAAIYGPAWDLWQNALVFLLIFALGTAAFASGVLGGGDVKLFAAVGLWLDLRASISLVALVFLCGGVVALVYLASRLFRGGDTGRKSQTRIPYGVAIALGALVLILLDPRVSGSRDRALPPINIGTHRA